jgi:hypothetical protein
MNQSQPFTIRLANGKEQTFATAADMAKWIAEQRQLEYGGRRLKSQRTARRPHKVPKKVPAAQAGEAPLNRFANRSRN